jgi:potassium-dependent mechanosensitive channel
MLKSTIYLGLAMAGTALAAFAPLHGQTAPATTNTAATNAPAASPSPAAIALGDVVTHAQAVTIQLQQDQAALDPDPTLQSVVEQLPNLSRQIEDRNTEDGRMLDGAATLSSLQTSEATWQSLSDSLATAQIDLSQRVRRLDDLLWKLSQMDATWKATLDAAKKMNAPAEMVQRIQEVLSLIAATTKAVQAHQAPLYLMQNRVAAQDALTRSGLDTVNKAMETARKQLFEQDHPPLWNPEALAHPPVGVVSQEKASLQTQLDALNAYLREKIGAVLIHLLLLALLVMGFYWIRNMIRQRAQEEAVLHQAARIFDVPIATALLLALIATALLYPQAPKLLWAVVGATALIPAVIVTRRLIDPENFPILYAAVIAYFVDQVRYVVTPAGILSRFLFIAELLAVGIFILIVLRSKHLTDSPNETLRLKRLTRQYLHLTFLVLVFAGFANVFGYIHLSILVGNGMLESSYLAVILYAAVRILDALAISALSIRPLASLRMVRRHQDLIYTNTATTIRWTVFVFWLVAALQLFSLRDPLWQEGNRLLWKDHSWFSMTFTLAALLAFPVTIWASFLISRFIRFVLHEEVYPHLQLGRGIPYAASTMVHYTILLIGFFAAVAATGAQLSQFAFLAGAFGVGLGFGMQNIMNNFVSGVILLFERPIKVGDTIQIDATTIGKVERIGIRASVILLANGSELIVPNGNLISNPVTNWTLSNCERLIEIPVNITSKADPQHILDLLTKTARANSNVLKNPPPQALLVTFAGAALSFKLRVWIDSEEEWMKITSDLSLAVNAALAKENITLG